MNKNWLGKCFDLAEVLYGVYPYEVLKELYKRGGCGDLQKHEAISFLEENSYLETDYVNATNPAFKALGYHEPGFFKPAIENEGAVYEYNKQCADNGSALALLHISKSETDNLLKKQGNTPFYIPTKDEMDRMNKDCINGNEYYDKLQKMMKKGRMVKYNILKIWLDFSAGVDFTKELDWILTVLDIKTVTVDKQKALDISIEELNKIAGLVIECYNHTNLRVKRGWEPAKLAEEINRTDIYNKKYS